MPSLKTLSPKIGFVSLGCPKALVDSEQILTQLRAEGYDTSSTYEDADLVIINTCGFIDSAVAESLAHELLPPGWRSFLDRCCFCHNRCLRALSFDYCAIALCIIRKAGLRR